MAPQSAIPYHADVNATCFLAYHLFYILASADQSYDIIDLAEIPSDTFRKFRLRMHHGHEEHTPYPLPDAEEKMHSAILMHNRCNQCWHIMKPWLLYLLHIIDKRIRITITCVFPAPNFVIQLNYDHPAEYHTVLHIYTPQGEYAFDMTAEQYGFGGPVFLPWTEYEARFTRPSFFWNEKTHYPLQYTKDQEAEALQRFRSGPDSRFGRRAEEVLSDLMAEWQRRLPHGEIRREHLASIKERDRLLHRFRELMHRARTPSS